MERLGFGGDVVGHEVKEESGLSLFRRYFEGVGVFTFSVWPFSSGEAGFSAGEVVVQVDYEGGVALAGSTDIAIAVFQL